MRKVFTLMVLTIILVACMFSCAPSSSSTSDSLSDSLTEKDIEAFQYLLDHKDSLTDEEIDSLFKNPEILDSISTESR